MSISNQKWLQIYAKAIELQILNSKQQEQMLENQGKMLAMLEKIEAHFSNGFRSEIKKHVEEQTKSVLEPIQGVQEEVKEVKESIGRQWWLWGGIALFTIANVIATIISLWANGIIVKGN